MTNPIPQVASDSEMVARLFHETYERLAPQFSYETRKQSAVPWEQVPENNRNLMIATVAEVLASLEAIPAQQEVTPEMIEAGVMEYHLRGNIPQGVVRAIYLAMRSAALGGEMK